MPDRNIIARRLINLRGGITRETVAAACKISLSALVMYELGERIPRDDVKFRLAKYYGVTVQSIFFDGVFT